MAVGRWEEGEGKSVDCVAATTSEISATMQRESWNVEDVDASRRTYQFRVSGQAFRVELLLLVLLWL